MDDGSRWKGPEYQIALFWEYSGFQNDRPLDEVLEQQKCSLRQALATFGISQMLLGSCEQLAFRKMTY
jgi:hypothetical protein